MGVILYVCQLYPFQGLLEFIPLLSVHLLEVKTNFADAGMTSSGYEAPCSGY